MSVNMSRSSFTGSIARSATRRYLIYPEADFEVFRPAGATRCTDGGEIWHRRVDQRSPPPCQISHPSVQRLEYGSLKTEIFTEIWSKCGFNINAPQGRTRCAICIKFAEFVPRFRMRRLLKFRWICSRNYGVMGVVSWGCPVTPKFSAPSSGATVRQTPERF